MFVFFPYFPRIMGIHYFHVLEIIWISASPEIFKKPINLKCLCFPILFPYYANPLFLCVGDCMDFCFKQKIPETLNFEMFVFSHIFSLLWEFTFLIFWELYVLMPHMKYVRNPQLWNVCVFPYVSLTMRIQFSHVFGIAWVSILREIEQCRIYKKPKPQEYLCFPITFPY